MTIDDIELQVRKFKFIRAIKFLNRGINDFALMRFCHENVLATNKGS